jgi:hypothetical protein
MGTLVQGTRSPHPCHLGLKGIVGKGKGCYTLIQGVTAPLNCRVFINPRSYVLISSSIPLCKSFWNAYRTTAIWKQIFSTWQVMIHWTRQGTEIIRRINFATKRWSFLQSQKQDQNEFSWTCWWTTARANELSMLDVGLQWNVCKEEG